MAHERTDDEALAAAIGVEDSSGAQLLMRELMAVLALAEGQK